MTPWTTAESHPRAVSVGHSGQAVKSDGDNESEKAAEDGSQGTQQDGGDSP